MINHPFLNIEGNHRSGADPYPQVKLLLSSTYSLKENTRRPIKQKRHPRSSTRLDASIYIYIYMHTSMIDEYTLQMYPNVWYLQETEARYSPNQPNHTVPYPHPSLGKPWRKWIRRATWGGLSLSLGVFELLGKTTGPQAFPTHSTHSTSHPSFFCALFHSRGSSPCPSWFNQSFQSLLNKRCLSDTGGAQKAHLGFPPCELGGVPHQSSVH